MKILIVNGSPAGEDSVTLQTMEYLKIIFPDHVYETLHAAQKIHSIERDFSEAKKSFESADLILFCYPVYTFLVPAQLHRFIELIKENGTDLSGKFATQVSTSKHFYDTTAHRFIADAVVYAFTIKDHSMGYRFKLYDDRQFCNGHRTVTMGKPVGYLVDGPLSEEENLRTLIEARAQVGGNFLAGVVSDETDPDRETDRMVRTLVYAVRNRYNPPKNFYGIGGLKIFRDLIFEMQGLMKEDHRFYKEHGFYDFPQRRKGRIAGMYLVSAMMNNEKIRKKIGISMTDGMMMSYNKVIEKAGKEKADMNERS